MATLPQITPSVPHVTAPEKPARRRADSHRPSYACPRCLSSQVVAQPDTDPWEWLITDEFGNSMPLSLSVLDATSVGELQRGGGLHLTAVPSVSSGRVGVWFGAALPHDVTVRVYDIAGRPVRSLRAARGVQGVEWDGADANGRRVAAGVYVATAEGFARTAARIVVAR